MLAGFCTSSPSVSCGQLGQKGYRTLQLMNCSSSPETFKRPWHLLHHMSTLQVLLLGSKLVVSALNSIQWHRTWDHFLFSHLSILIRIDRQTWKRNTDLFFISSNFDPQVSTSWFFYSFSVTTAWMWFPDSNSLTALLNGRHGSPMEIILSRVRVPTAMERWRKEQWEQSDIFVHEI